MAPRKVKGVMAIRSNDFTSMEKRLKFVGGQDKTDNLNIDPDDHIVVDLIEEMLTFKQLF